MKVFAKMGKRSLVIGALLSLCACAGLASSLAPKTSITAVVQSTEVPKAAIVQQSTAPPPTPTTPTTPAAAPTGTAAMAIAQTPEPTQPAPHCLSGARTGAKCKDGSYSDNKGQGACSRHGGVAEWLLCP